MEIKTGMGCERNRREQSTTGAAAGATGGQIRKAALSFRMPRRGEDRKYPQRYCKAFSLRRGVTLRACDVDKKEECTEAREILHGAGKAWAEHALDAAVGR